MKLEISIIKEKEKVFELNKIFNNTNKLFIVKENNEIYTSIPTTKESLDKLKEFFELIRIPLLVPVIAEIREYNSISLNKDEEYTGIDMNPELLKNYKILNVKIPKFEKYTYKIVFKENKPEIYFNNSKIYNNESVFIYNKDKKFAIIEYIEYNSGKNDE